MKFDRIFSKNAATSRNFSIQFNFSMIIPEIHFIFDSIFDLILFDFVLNFHIGTTPGQRWKPSTEASRRRLACARRGVGGAHGRLVDAPGCVRVPLGDVPGARRFVEAPVFFSNS